MSTFQELVLACIKDIPKGRVMSYGQVAAHCGKPRAARQVGQVLRGLDDTSSIPWWRVVNSKGFLSIRGNWEATKETQKQLLEKEGVRVSGEYIVDLINYQIKK